MNESGVAVLLAILRDIAIIVLVVVYVLNNA